MKTSHIARVGVLSRSRRATCKLVTCTLAYLHTCPLANLKLLALREGLMAQPDLVLGTYPHYNTLPDGPNSPFNIRHSLFYAQAYLRLGMIYEARAKGIRKTVEVR